MSQYVIWKDVSGCLIINKIIMNKNVYQVYIVIAVITITLSTEVLSSAVNIVVLSSLRNAPVITFLIVGFIDVNEL